MVISLSEIVHFWKHIVVTRSAQLRFLLFVVLYFFSLAVPQEPQPFDYETIVVRLNCINMSDRLFLKHNSRMLIAVIGGRRTLLMVAQDGIEPS